MILFRKQNGPSLPPPLPPLHEIPNTAQPVINVFRFTLKKHVFLIGYSVFDEL